MRRRLLWSIAAGAAALAVLVTIRHYQFAYAAIVGIAIGALVFAAIGTAERLRSLYRK